MALLYVEKDGKLHINPIHYRIHDLPGGLDGFLAFGYLNRHRYFLADIQGFIRFDKYGCGAGVLYRCSKPTLAGDAVSDG